MIPLELGRINSYLNHNIFMHNEKYTNKNASMKFSNFPTLISTNSRTGMKYLRTFEVFRTTVT